MTNPAAETESIGLPADAQAVKVFAAQLRQLYHDETTSYLLPGPAKTLQPRLGRQQTIPAGRYGQAIENLSSS